MRFSAVLISHPEFADLASVVANILGPEYEIKSSNDGKYVHLAYLSKTAFHKQTVDLYPNRSRPQTQSIGGRNRYIYYCYLFEIKTAGRSLFLFAAPYKGIVKKTFNFKIKTKLSGALSFHFIALEKFCKKFEWEELPNSITVSVICLRTCGDVRLKNITLSGSDVLGTEIYKTITYMTTPTSLKFTYSFEHSKFISITTDEACSWSFSLSSQDELDALLRVIASFNANRLLRSTYFYPTYHSIPYDELVE